MWPMLVLLIWLADPVIPQARALNNYQINPKPCWVKGLQGKCMFVWECINSGGRHVGMCVEAFMFGTCCTHNLTESDLSRVPSSNERRPQLTGQQSRPNDLMTTRPPFITRPNYHQHAYKPSSQNYDKWNKPPANELEAASTDGHSGQAERPQKAPQAGIGGWAGFVTKQRPAGRPTSQQTTKLRPVPRPPPQMATSTTTSSPPTSRTSTVSTSTSTTSTTTTSTTSTTTPKPHVVAGLVTSPPPTSHGVSATNMPVQCGSPPLHPPRPEVRIVGGRNAQFGVWPWQVSVRRTSFFGFSSTHRCGGALINERWIATAGHCVDDLLTSQIRIRVGEYDFSSIQEPFPYAERGVGRKVVHPKYNFFTYEYDLALVKLDNPLEFAPHIAPICLPGSDDLLIGENATVTGWGRLSDGGTLPSVLQEVTVPIISNDRCKNMFLRAGRHEFFPDIFICAGFDDGGRDACQGDSGGPLQVRGKDGRYFLAGIISWGIGCAEANLPGVCTRISKFVPWILETVT